MKQRHRLRLLAVMILCAAPLTAPAQTIRPQEPPRWAPRLSHVPIQGGISAALADQFLNDRLQQADAAQMERLLADLAEHPEKIGIKEPKDQEVLKNALDKAGGQPEKLLQDPAVRKIIVEAAANQEKKPDLSPEDQERIKEYARRFLPPSEPRTPDPGKPEEAPGVSPQAKMLDPVKHAEGAKPLVQSGAPRPGAGAPPQPPPPPAKSPMKERLRDFAETLADRGLSDSPAFRRMLTNLDRVKAPQAAGLGTWERRLEGLEQRFAEVGMRLPNHSWPKVDLAPRGPGRRVIPDAGAPGEASGGSGEVVLMLLAAGIGALVAWGLLRRRGLVVLRRGGDSWRLGPWPVRPEAVHTRDELVRAFEYLALLRLGPAARSRNHHDVAAGLGQDDATCRAAERLAGLYEQARYAPPDEALPDADLAAARADLSLLAGVAAA